MALPWKRSVEKKNQQISRLKQRMTSHLRPFDIRRFLAALGDPAILLDSSICSSQLIRRFLGRQLIRRFLRCPWMQCICLRKRLQVCVGNGMCIRVCTCTFACLSDNVCCQKTQADAQMRIYPAFTPVCPYVLPNTNKLNQKMPDDTRWCTVLSIAQVLANNTVLRLACRKGKW